MKFFLILCLALAVNGEIQLSERPLLIGSFNIKSLGETKLSRQDVFDKLIEILKRYDLIFIMEIRDSSGKTVPKIVEKLNEEKTISARYNFSISDKLGRGLYKEQFAYIFRQSTVALLQTINYPDQPDEFERNPYIVQFRFPTASIDNITFVGVHLRPDDVFNETMALPTVVDEIRKTRGVENVLIAGDMNIDCNYIKPHEFNELELYEDKSYKWLIGRCHGRTMISTWCQYDRLIATGEEFLKQGIVPNSAAVYKFDEVFNLNTTEALKISDHRPVEFQIPGRINMSLLERLKSRLTFSVHQPISDASQQQVRAMYRTSEHGNFNVTRLEADGRYHSVEARTSASDLRGSLEEFSRLFPGVLKKATVATVLKHVGMIQAPPTVSTLQPIACQLKSCQATTLTVRCTLQDPWSCGVEVSVSVIKTV